METGTILAAVVSAAVASIGVTLAKDGKVSEFRQQWIDALRDDVAEFIAMLVRIYQKNQSIEKGKYAPKQGDDLLGERANIALYKIVLRLDVKEKEKDDMDNQHRTLHRFLLYARTVATDTPEASKDDLNTAIKQVEKATIEVLDTAWKRVQSGEPTFKFVRYASYVALCVALLLLGGQSAWSWYHRNEGTVTRFEVTKPVIVDLQPQSVAVPTQNTPHPVQPPQSVVPSAGKPHP